MAAQRFKIVVFALLIAPSLAFAFDMSKLSELHRSGDAAKTYAYAAQYVETMAGDPEYDYYYGVAAINSGHASEGVFALERVLAGNPQNRSARLVLAQGYFTLEEYGRSRSEFEAVRESEPGAEAEALIKRYLRAIKRQEGRYKTSATAYAEFGVGHSDNINNAPENQNVGGFTVADPALDDSYTALAAGYRLNAPVSPGRSLFFGGAIDYQSNADETRFNAGDLDLHGGLRVFNDLNRYTVKLSLQRFYLDDKVYRKATSLLGEWRHRSSQARHLNGFVQFSTYDYPTNEIRDTSNLTIGAGIAQTIDASSAPIVYGNLFAGHEDADSDTAGARAVAERNFGGFQAGLQSNLSPRVRWVNELSWLSSQYAEARAVPNTTDRKRNDQLLRLRSELIWELTRGFSLRGELGYSQNNSNINAFDYDGVSGDLRIRYELD